MVGFGCLWRVIVLSLVACVGIVDGLEICVGVGVSSLVVFGC